MNKFVIYVHSFPNGKRYVGITSQKPEKRWANGHGYSSQPIVYAAINKYGWHNIEHRILYTGLSKDEACALEIKIISEWDTTNPEKGYNYSPGGELGLLGRHRSDETKQKIRDAVSGQTPPWLGRHLSDEHKQHIRDKKDCKPVRCIETGMVYQSLYLAERDTGCLAESISRNCKGIIKNPRSGLHWEFVNGGGSDAS